MGTNVFKLNADGQYQIVDYIKSDEEIDKETFEKIKAAYPDEPGGGLPLEVKMLRIGIINPQDAAFAAYNNFVNQCRAEGTARKQAAATARAALMEITLPGDTSGTKIMVKA